MNNIFHALQLSKYSNLMQLEKYKQKQERKTQKKVENTCLFLRYISSDKQSSSVRGSNFILCLHAGLLVQFCDYYLRPLARKQLTDGST